MEIFDKDKYPVSFQVCATEYDSPELKRLIDWLNEGGWKITELERGVAGSQELTSYEVTKGEIRAVLQFETYLGVTLLTRAEFAEEFSKIKINT